MTPISIFRLETPNAIAGSAAKGANHLEIPYFGNSFQNGVTSRSTQIIANKVVMGDMALTP